MNDISKIPKVVIAATLLIGIVSAVFYLKAQWFDDGSFLTTSTIRSDKVSRLAAAGNDLRVYEFTPQSAPYMQCVFVSGDNKGDVDCFKKENYVPNQNVVTKP